MSSKNTLKNPKKIQEAKSKTDIILESAKSSNSTKFDKKPLIIFISLILVFMVILMIIIFLLASGESSKPDKTKEKSQQECSPLALCPSKESTKNIPKEPIKSQISQSPVSNSSSEPEDTDINFEVVEPIGQSLESFPSLESELFKEFGTDISSLQPGQFRVSYINSKTQKLVSREVVENIGISFIYDDLPGLNSENFQAFYEGKIEFTQPTDIEVSLSSSWSASRVYINDKLIIADSFLKPDSSKGFDDDIQNTKKTQIIRFEPGVYKVQVEYINDWHTTDFALKFNPVLKSYTPDMAFSQVKQAFPEAKYLFVGIYEPRDIVKPVFLNLAAQEKDVVLILSSYESTQWELTGPGKDKVQAIIFGSYKNGTTVQNFDPNKLYKIKSDFDYAYEIDQRFAAIFDSLIQNYNIKIQGFSGEYDTQSLSVPTYEFDSNNSQSILDKFRSEN